MLKQNDELQDSNSKEPQDLMETNYDNAILCWDSVLDVQTELLFPFEYQFFLKAQEWTNAQHILDVGCGNGTYIERLRAFSPGKTFTGIDISNDLISIAKSNIDADEIKFEEIDFFQYQPEQPYDAILMRFTVQHMRTLREIFSQAQNITTKHASLFIIEPEPHLLKNVPITPNFYGTLQKVEEASSELSKNRGALNELAELVRTLPEWELRGDETVLLPQTGPFENTKLLQLYHLWVDIFENSKSFDFDYSSVRQELDSWGEKENAYSQFAIRIYHLKRK